jgi:hypothetical protein
VGQVPQRPLLSSQRTPVTRRAVAGLGHEPTHAVQQNRASSVTSSKANTVMSTWIATRCVQLWGRKNVFTRPGSTAAVWPSAANVGYSPIADASLRSSELRVWARSRHSHLPGTRLITSLRASGRCPPKFGYTRAAAAHIGSKTGNALTFALLTAAPGFSTAPRAMNASISLAVLGGPNRKPCASL